ncbi:somatostatin receptor type 5-like [Diadema antillarum]|uniref:somatostatin receptor type 5-like n=1 Tax=Diadema antillarum TaxID=105358 RepID=UPI003A850774
MAVPCHHASMIYCQGPLESTESNGTNDSPVVGVDNAFAREVTVVVISCFIILIGLAGNALVVYAIVTVKSMHTVCNVFVANIAVRDIVFLGTFGLISVIAHGIHRLQGEEAHKNVVSVYALMVTVMVGAASITALVQNRYRSISRPLNSKTQKKIKPALLIVTCIWVVSLVLCIVNPILNTPSGKLSWFIVIIVLFLVAYALPLTAVIVCYVAIYLAVRRGQQVSGEGEQIARWDLRRKLRILRMVAYVCLSCTVAWGFWFGINIFVAYEVMAGMPLHNIDDFLYDFAGILVCASSAINPIIYGATNASFNRCFKKLLCERFAPRTFYHTASSPDTLDERRDSSSRNGRKRVRLSMIELANPDRPDDGQRSSIMV